jgi:hypothetical protein
MQHAASLRKWVAQIAKMYAVADYMYDFPGILESVRSWRCFRGDWEFSIRKGDSALHVGGSNAGGRKGADRRAKNRRRASPSVRMRAHNARSPRRDGGIDGLACGPNPWRDPHARG